VPSMASMGASSAMTRGRDLLPCAGYAKIGMEHQLQLIFFLSLLSSLCMI
jgi:hypothetical protein